MIRAYSRQPREKDNQKAQGKKAQDNQKAQTMCTPLRRLVVKEVISCALLTL